MLNTRAVPRPTTWRDRDDQTPSGLTIAGGAVTIVGAALVASLVPATDLTWRVALVVVALAMFAVITVDPRAVLALVPLAWLVVNGFLVDRFGVLSWHGWPDVLRLLVLAVAGGLGLLVGNFRRGTADRDV